MRKKIFFLFYALIFASLMSGGLGGRASALMLKKSVPELANKASAILIGRVTSTKSEWSSDRTKIYTYVTISVSEAIKGVSDTEIVIRCLGGEIVEEDIGMRVSDSATFEEGEDVLVFVEPTQENNFGVVNMAQGKYSILMQQKSGERVVADNWGKKISGIRNGMLEINAASANGLLLGDLVNYIKQIVDPNNSGIN